MKWRLGRIPKSETLNLHSMILDDPPTIEIANRGLGLHALRSLFDTYSIPMAMVGVAHLASLKDYYLRFLSFMSARLEADSGLRNPSILEAQSADKTLMGVVCDLVTWWLNVVGPGTNPYMRSPISHGIFTATPSTRKANELLG